MPMPRRRLHPSGPEFSSIVWGLWRVLDANETRSPEGLARMIALCLDLGVTSLDNADVYGGFRCEEAFGRALRVWGGERSRLELVSKCGCCPPVAARPDNWLPHYNSTRAYIERAVETTLRDIGTDYVDLLLVHRPDPLMDAEETAAALDSVVTSGKVRSIGVSNHSASQVDLLQSFLKNPIVTNQIEFSVSTVAPLYDGTLDQAQRLRFAPMAWSPLGGGGLFKGETPKAQRVLAALARVGDKLGGADPAQVALAWLLRHPSRTLPVVGTTQSARLRSLAAAAALDMDRQDWFDILQASNGHPIP